MGKFKKYFVGETFFTKKGENKFQILEMLIQQDDKYIIEYISLKVKKKEKLIIPISEIKDYKFFERTTNFTYKTWREKSLPEVLSESGNSVGGGALGPNAGAGLGTNTADQFSADTYATGDARNIFGSGKKPKVQKRNFPETITGKKKAKKKSSKKKK